MLHTQSLLQEARQGPRVLSHFAIGPLALSKDQGRFVRVTLGGRVQEMNQCDLGHTQVVGHAGRPERGNHRHRQRLRAINSFITSLVPP